MGLQQSRSSRPRASFKFRIGTSLANGEFILYKEKEVDHHDGWINTEEVEYQEVNYGEVLMAIKNSMLFQNLPEIEFMNEGTGEVWCLKLVPLNNQAMDDFAKNIRSKE